jgi:hypothetical protein
MNLRLIATLACQWFCGLNGVQNGSVSSMSSLRSFDEAKTAFAAAWRGWLTAARLVDETRGPESAEPSKSARVVDCMMLLLALDLF